MTLRLDLRVTLTLLGLAGLIGAAFAPGASAQPRRLPVADPAFAFLVEGHILLADGRPAAGVVIERDQVPRFVAESRTTDARGRFRFERRGLGWGPGVHWNMTLRRPGCADVPRTITLRRGPFREFSRDQALAVVLRLPVCERAARKPTRHQATP